MTDTDSKTASTYSGPTALCVHSMDLMATGSREDFERVIHPQAVNREAANEPPAARQPGPAGFYATAHWLRGAFSGLRFEIHEAVEHDDLVVLHVTMFRPPHRRLRHLPAGHHHRGRRHATGREGIRHHPDPLVPHSGRHDQRALGQPRRPRHGQASRVDTTITKIPAARGTRQTACPETLSMTSADALAGHA